MIAERFLGRKPSHFHLNPIVKAYIVSEAFLWSAWDFVLPLFAVFVVNTIDKGNIQIAAGGYSTYLVTRVVFELVSGRILVGSKDRQKIIISMIGMVCISIAYIGFAFSSTILNIFLFYFILGMGLGTASPAKNTLFATHLNKDKESTEWSLTDAVTFICMAMATALGGFIAAQYGFRFLFSLASIVNLVAIVPYILYIKTPREKI